MSPNAARPEFITNPIRLSVEPMTKGETPSARIRLMTAPSGFIVFRFTASIAPGDRRTFRIHSELTPCERTVAIAAPLTPIPNVKMNSGSSAILMQAPIRTETIAAFGCPSVVRNGFSPIVIITKIVPVMYHAR